MDYPKTDDDWVRLAECIVRNLSYPPPEEVGQLSVEATATIFSWYKGDEKVRVRDRRQDARDRMIELGKQAGCLEEREEELPWMRPKEVVEHGSYVIFTNLDTGETKQYYNANPPDSTEVVSAAMFIKPVLEERWGKNIKFDIVPAEKLPAEGPPGRPFPETYGDWANLAENIKEKYPDDPVMRATVNYQLGIIAREEEVAPVEEEADVDEAKRWLTRIAGELGIK